MSVITKERNSTFSRYVTSTAFNLILTKDMIDCLKCSMKYGVQPLRGYQGLLHRGLVAEDNGKWYVTEAGKLVARLLEIAEM